MIRRTGKIALEVVGVAVAATAVLLAVLAWRLSSGPVSVSFLGGMIENAAGPSLQGGALDIGDTVLRWSAEDRRLSLRLMDVRLTGADGNDIAFVPQLAFQVSLPALFRGVLAPTSVDFHGVSATLLRRPGTGITLAMAGADTPAQPADPEAAAFVARLIEGLSAGDETGTPLDYLTHVGIRDGTLRLVDEVNGVAFDAPSANLVVFRGEGGLGATLRANIAIDDTTATIEMTGLLPSGSDIARIDARAANVVPAAFARMSPAFADYAIVNAPVEARGELQIKANGDMLAARLTLDAGRGEIDLPDPWDASIPIEKAHAEVEFDGVARRIDLIGLTFEAGPHHAALSGRLDYRVAEGLNIAGAAVDLVASNIHTEVPGFFEGPVDLDNARLKGDFDFETLTAEIGELTIETAGGGVSVSGSVRDGERSPAVRVSGRLDAMPLDDFKAIWPLPLAKGAREWVGKNLSGGDVTGGSFEIDMPAGMIDDADNRIPIPDENLQVEFAVKGATLRYIGEMPPMENVDANGQVTGNRFDAWVSSAEIKLDDGGTLAVSEGHFDADELNRKGAPGRIAFTVDGATADILTLLDHEPLNLIRNFGVDPRNVAGAGHVQGRLELPLVKTVTIADVDFGGTAKAADLAIPEILKNVSITAGTLDIDVSRAGLVARGPIGINGAPPLDLEWRESFVRESGVGSSYRLSGVLDDDGRNAVGVGVDDFLDGPAAFDATFNGDGREVNRATVNADLTGAVVKLGYAGWSKAPGVPAAAELRLAFLTGGGFRVADFKLTGDEIEARGNFSLGPDGRLTEADFPVVKLGPDNDFAFAAGPADDAAVAMTMGGARFDARQLLADIVSGSEKDDDEADEEPLLLSPAIVADPARRTTIRAEIARATGNNDTMFRAVSADVVQVDGRLWTLNVTAVDPQEAPLTVRIAPDDAGIRRLAIASNDAGIVFRALDFTNSMRGGTLSATGVYDDTIAGSLLKGVVTIDAFRIANAPVLANILTVGSLTGIRDTLNGEGILFNRLELPFAITEGSIIFDDARTSGPAIGLTIKGNIDRTTDQIDMEGTLVPAYTINSFLGQVPVLGPLIVGREGEGIFALTYRVRGQPDEPSVTVNPLSALAPGFLRRMFEFGGATVIDPPVARPSPANSSVLPDDTAPATPAPDAPPAPQN
ncbi:MAG: AsmA-like C-terminal domain-containing protein [Parvibaculum sp.]|uniref:YhdP family protein n=1 Tax=Parvibaculum sp. TaxID=2024848 RepID=UPI0032EB0E02